MENINPKLNLDERPQINEPTGKQEPPSHTQTHTHTNLLILSLWGLKT